MEKGLRAAVRRFPLRAHDVTELARTDSEFSALCDDLADAEAAAESWAASASPQKATLQSEYRVLADELAAEIELALGERFGGISPPKRP
jgi:hypothetical protein